MGGISHGGPAFANGLAVLIEASIGMLILSIRWKGVDFRRIVLDLAKALAATSVMTGVVLLLGKVLPSSDLIQLVVGGGVGLLIYFVVVYFLGIKDVINIPLAMIKLKTKA